MSEGYWQHLQPLRIPTGWTIGCNKLEDLEPKELSKQDRIWLFAFMEDILYMYTTLSRKRNGQFEQQKLALDLGWYPDGEPGAGTTCRADIDSPPNPFKLGGLFSF